MGWKEREHQMDKKKSMCDCRPFATFGDGWEKRVKVSVKKKVRRSARLPFEYRTQWLCCIQLWTHVGDEAVPE